MKRALFSLPLIVAAFACCKADRDTARVTDYPRIVNIVNFIRLTEPRDGEITDEVLYRTVERQVEMLNRHKLKATFLLQYDALIEPSYQRLLKEQLFPGSETGAWWEITEPHVKAAGIPWRGRFPWDWHADVGFSPGYTPEEREKLVDVYMEEYRSVFGVYPSSVGSWFIDAHTLGYMYDKYGITASCNCKDQIGTDGYTLWGGYWSGGYYPSRVNAYMPAQTAQGQIPVPVFRMLGSDPSYQYDAGTGSGVSQGVITLEPVYPEAGGDRRWVEWFFKAMFDDPCLGYTYLQAGQENSFTWDAMKDGLEIQIPILAEYSRQGKIRVETLVESGKWFREKYPLTPPTAVTSLTDYRPRNRRTVWYNSRNYRANLLWEGDRFTIRDIHIFDENFMSDYLREPLTSSQCVYTTLPLVDGNLWSQGGDFAGIRLLRSVDGEGMREVTGKREPVVTENVDTFTVEWPLEGPAQTLRIVFTECKTEIGLLPGNSKVDWELRLETGAEALLPYTAITADRIEAELKGFGYHVLLENGTAEDMRDTPDGTVFRLVPTDDKIVLSFTDQTRL